MRKNEKFVDNDCWKYILLLIALTILIKVVNPYTFKIFDFKLSYALFLLPLVYFIVDYIAKRYDYKKAVAAIAISSVIFISFNIILSYVVKNKLLLTTVNGEFCGYVVSQFINLTIYMFLLNNTKSPYILVLLNYVFSLIVYYMFYTLMYLNLISFDHYWLNYFMTLGIQTVICGVLALIDISIKRGQEKKEN